jgi:hypothetical protein
MLEAHKLLLYITELLNIFMDRFIIFLIILFL